MSRSLNRITIIGYAGADAELRHTSGGSRVANFTIATAHSWMAEDRRQEQTTWHRCVAWDDRAGDRRQLATQADKLIRKGSRVFVEGRIEATSWQGADGAVHHGWQIRVSQFLMLDKAPGLNRLAEDADDAEL